MLSAVGAFRRTVGIIFDERGGDPIHPASQLPAPRSHPERKTGDTPALRGEIFLNDLIGRGEALHAVPAPPLYWRRWRDRVR